MNKPRKPEAEIDSMFIDRWSPRAFDNTKLDQGQINSLFEAARWAPSCFNEQPWFFMYANTVDEHARFASILNDRNRSWAIHAPLLVFVLARKYFKTTGKLNRHALFDAGAAWMSLALQARKLGLYAHAMAGFKVDAAYEILEVPRDQYEVVAAVAIGPKGDKSLLDEELAEKESPNSRNPLSTMVQQGKFSASKI